MIPSNLDSTLDRTLTPPNGKNDPEHPQQQPCTAPWTTPSHCPMTNGPEEPEAKVEPFSQDKPKPFTRNSIGTSKPLKPSKTYLDRGTSWKLGIWSPLIFWNLHLEPVLVLKLGTSSACLLGTSEPFVILPLLETSFLGFALGTWEFGTSWNFETFQNHSLGALVAWNCYLTLDLEPLLGPFSWNLATHQNQTILGTLEHSKPVLGTVYL